MPERTAEEIEAEIAEVRQKLRELDDVPTSFNYDGISADYTQNAERLRARLKSLNAELSGLSDFQGPWIVV
jgi:DNA repair exonuclease SbcCD ATPase subunit